MEVKDAIAKIEARIRELKRDYELFFKGDLRRAPLAERHKLQAAIEKLQQVHITNTQIRFKLQTVASQFSSFAHYWDRIMAQIEAGTYAPDRFKADMRVGKLSEVREAAQQSAVEESREANRQPAPPAPPKEADGIKELYRQFVESRRRTGEGADVNFEAFERSIEKQRPALEAKFGGKVQFKVVVEEGKAKIKGFTD
ncbi:MAG: hypothetical protein GX444_05240 [Myxococcales bacterium]|nr:hypothetical protein [Myxococcales bacterium]